MNTNIAFQNHTVDVLIPSAQPDRPSQAEPQISLHRWGSLPLKEFEMDAKEAGKYLPQFDRVAPEEFGLGPNPHFDLVIRRPTPDAPLPVPVGMVSKTYKIVQHRELLEKFCGYAAKIPGAKLGRVEVSMTENGERAMFRVDLGEKWAFGPDGNSVGLQIICRNSVDGSSAVRLHLGWFRFICSNGMIVGVTLGKARMAHKESSDMDCAFAPIERQLEIAKTERENLAAWAKLKVPLAKVQEWVDAEVLKSWNSLSAARVWHICRSGRDARFIPPFERNVPSGRKVELLEKVPGAPPEARTIFDVAQGLSWVVSRRKDVDESEAYQRTIGPLIEALKN